MSVCKLNGNANSQVTVSSETIENTVFVLYLQDTFKSILHITGSIQEVTQSDTPGCLPSPKTSHYLLIYPSLFAVQVRRHATNTGRRQWPHHMSGTCMVRCGGNGGVCSCLMTIHRPPAIPLTNSWWIRGLAGCLPVILNISLRPA